jgi:hypothetical protein
MNPPLLSTSVYHKSALAYTATLLTSYDIVFSCRMPSSGMCQRVAVIRADVSEERINFRFNSNCRWVFTRWHYHCDNTTHKYTYHIHNTHITYTQTHISHKITPLKTHKDTQTVKGMLQPMNTA